MLRVARAAQQAESSSHRASTLAQRRKHATDAASPAAFSHAKKFTGSCPLPPHMGAGLVPHYIGACVTPRHIGAGQMQQHIGASLMPQCIGAGPVYYIPEEAFDRTSLTRHLGS
ncbi:g12677 [Coccomyxa viridis]|uniref:G12677 protein n=1 Tax=Coccomyxa viridis TaxID=1274662 RepID=A0ABP1GDJ7_9CHLO